MIVQDATKSSIKNICQSCRKKGLGRYEITTKCSNCDTLNKIFDDECRNCGEPLTYSEGEKAQVKNDLDIPVTVDFNNKNVRKYLERIPLEKRSEVADYLCVFCQGLADKRTKPLTY